MKAGQLELLQKLFNVVYIPNSVYRELTESSTYLEEVQMIRECSFLFVENEKSVFFEKAYGIGYRGKRSDCIG